MPEEPQVEPPPLDPQRFHERWDDAGFELVADRRPWSPTGTVIVGGGLVMLLILVGGAIHLWSTDRLTSVLLIACLPVYLAFYFPLVADMRFSRVLITLSRHEIRLSYRPARMREKELRIPRSEFLAFATRMVRVGGSGVAGQTTVDRLMLRTKDGDLETGWRTFASEAPRFKELAARLNWALTQVDEKKTYRD